MISMNGLGYLPFDFSQHTDGFSHLKNSQGFLFNDFLKNQRIPASSEDDTMIVYGCLYTCSQSLKCKHSVSQKSFSCCIHFNAFSYFHISGPRVSLF